MVEDAEAGVQGAIDCGMKAVGIGPKERVGKANWVYAEPGDIRLTDMI